MDRPIKILFLASNPTDTDRLRLDEEMRGVDQALRHSEFRDKFDVKQHWAVRVVDIQGYFLRYKPDIVHFSGHGSPSNEIILEDNEGNSQPISNHALSQLFFLLKDNIRCVVLNACYSEQQANAIAKHIDCVIGMSKAIGDPAAINFAVAFYQALGFGRDVKTAFELGCLQIDLANLDEQNTPKLIAINNDPLRITFVNESLSKKHPNVRKDDTLKASRPSFTKTDVVSDITGSDVVDFPNNVITANKKRSSKIWIWTPALILTSIILFYTVSLFTNSDSTPDQQSYVYNTQPVIEIFRFKPDPDLSPYTFPDSLKFKHGKTYRLQLVYDDQEINNSDTRRLQARFSFESGSGKISHAMFCKPSADGLMFDEAPGKFNGDLLFTPDAPGMIRLQLQLIDGIKLSETKQASATFFEDLKPLPAFTLRLFNLTNPYEVEFNPERSQDCDGTIAKFIWTFGDNSKPEMVLSNSRITHRYQRAGQYRVRLRVIDDEGLADSTEQLVTTNNQRPQAALRITPTSGDVPLEIAYTATGSFDPDGSIYSYQVFFDDGETSQIAAGKHIFKNDANYQVMLIVKDNLGLADTANVPVFVSTPPIAILKITPEAGGPIPLKLTINGKDSRDPHPGGSISAYEITITNLDTREQQTFPQDFVATTLTSQANYHISLKVTNNRNLSHLAEKVIPVRIQ